MKLRKNWGFCIVSPHFTVDKKISPLFHLSSIHYIAKRLSELSYTIKYTASIRLLS
jgi:hypothetical protein